LQTGNSGGDRDDPHWRQRFPDQTVEKGTFPSLKLPKNTDVNQFILMEKMFTGLDLAVQEDDLELIADPMKPAQ